MENKRLEILYKILEIVSEETGVPVSVITGEGQKREAADARKIYCYAVKQRKELTFSLLDIGMPIRKSHATILNNQFEAENLIFTNKLFARIVNRVLVRLNVPDITVLLNEYENIPQL